MPAPRIVVVVNPRAQDGALGRRWPELAGVLRRELGGFEEATTTGPGDATRIARDAVVGGADTVVAIGGDGTIGEVAAGFFEDGVPRAGDAALGIIPFGTGGDFRKSVALPRDPAAAARVVAERFVRRIDVGHLRHAKAGGGEGQRVFINIASFGMSGLVDQLVNTSSKRLGGRASFLLATARAGLRFQNQRVRMIFDEDATTARDVTINTVAIANGRYFGGGMHIAPDAELDDGAFDVIAVGDLSKADFLLHGHRMYRGSHLSLDGVTCRRARVVEAAPVDGAEVLLDVDGETPGILPATFQLVPRALSLIVPGSAA